MNNTGEHTITQCWTHASITWFFGAMDYHHSNFTIPQLYHNNFDAWMFLIMCMAA